MISHIGIIGAGPAGLAALKRILDSPPYKVGKWRPVVFEARDNVGGVWYPSTYTSFNSLPATPLYDSLTTNLPHPSMAYSDFSFPPSTPLFPPAATVQRYLETYAENFKLIPHIQFKTRVVRVTWSPTAQKWIVRVKRELNHGVNGEENEHEFDHLMVCNGHHNVPRYPSTPGLEPWRKARRAFHSMFYRNPSTIFDYSSSLESSKSKKELQHCTILVMGNGPSGLDITSELVPLACRVLHSFSAYSSASRISSNSNSPSTDSRPESLNSNSSNLSKLAILKPRATQVLFAPASCSATVYFEDGSIEENVDYCILATGYEVSFPFFDSNAHSSESETFQINVGIPSFECFTPNTLPHHLFNTTWSVFPIARHLFGIPECGFSRLRSPAHHNLPPPHSLAFLGLLVRVVPLPLVEAQACAALAAFEYPHAVNWEVEKCLLNSRIEKLQSQWQEQEERNAPLNSGGNDVKEDSTRTEKMRSIVARNWQRFNELEQFEYRDGLDDFVASITSSSDTLRRSLKTKHWERDIYLQKGALRRKWGLIESRGESESWVNGVGSDDAEWVKLMWKVLKDVVEGEKL